MPDTAWPINGHPPDLSRDSGHTPVSMSSETLSTRQQRFTCVRLPDPYLTPLTTPFPHRSLQRSSTQCSMRWFEASPRRAAPKGHKSFIFRTAPFPEAVLQPTPLHVQDTRPAGLGSYTGLLGAPTMIDMCTVLRKREVSAVRGVESVCEPYVESLRWLSRARSSTLARKSSGVDVL